ncbi:hypothetical protein F5887DRAFT_1218644 [Amanita rubescens]|nr:hypothetical protein F5887DRAFT_1218644 [Amanita rubescens]
MLFLHELLFFLLFILLGPSMVSAELGHPPTDLIRLPDLTQHGGTWLRKPGTTANPKYSRDVITTPGQSTGIVSFHIFRQPGGPDVLLTQRNKDRLLGRWRQLPEGHISLRDRLSELSIWERGGKINHQITYAEVHLPSTQRPPSGGRTAEPLPAECEGTWYRVVEGLEGDSHSSDVILVSPGKPPQLGQLESNDMSIYPPNKVATMGRLVGGWLLWPGRSGWEPQPKDLLLIWIQNGKLKYRLTSPTLYIQNQFKRKER